MSGRLWLRSPFDKLRVSGKTCPAASPLRPLQGGEGEQQLLDASLALEGDDHLVVGAGGLAGDDDPLTETGVAHVVAGGEDFGGRRGRGSVGGSPFDRLRVSGGDTISALGPEGGGGGTLRRGRQVGRDVRQKPRGRVVAAEGAPESA